MSKLLSFKWTISRAMDTLGYNICSLWIDGKKVSTCNGGGYDMEGTTFAEFIEKAYQDRLMAIHDKADGILIIKSEGPYERKGRILGAERGLYGMTSYYNEKMEPQRVCLAGASGMASMETIAREIGLNLKFVPRAPRSKRGNQYIMEDTKEAQID